jgi:hypothetical protein
MDCHPLNGRRLTAARENIANKNTMCVEMVVPAAGPEGGLAVLQTGADNNIHQSSGGFR